MVITCFLPRLASRCFLPLRTDDTAELLEEAARASLCTPQLDGPDGTQALLQTCALVEPPEDETYCLTLSMAVLLSGRVAPLLTEAEPAACVAPPSRTPALRSSPWRAGGVCDEFLFRVSRDRSLLF
ncbi:hypothetical protein EYF80_053386 [Liparis tanakae]|uniref:Uncharacterized protein n=1 Tax=Liparis tanakae TaxID=230148 RepID=A0A4Z2F6Q8_9TELE|nr:hypothetical protein EYF80_053386 [Liparis tanakae]